jgi:hypothetical protein
VAAAAQAPRTRYRHTQLSAIKLAGDVNATTAGKRLTSRGIIKPRFKAQAARFTRWQKKQRRRRWMQLELPF